MYLLVYADTFIQFLQNKQHYNIEINKVKPSSSLWQLLLTWSKKNALLHVSFMEATICIVSHVHALVQVLMLQPLMYFFFIIQRVKACAIPCPYPLLTRGDNTVSVAQGSTAIPGATKQVLPSDRVLRELYIYTPDQLRAETTLDVNLHF